VNSLCGLSEDDQADFGSGSMDAAAVVLPQTTVLFGIGKCSFDDFATPFGLHSRFGRCHLGAVGVKKLLVLKTLDDASLHRIPHTASRQGATAAMVGRALIAVLDNGLIATTTLALFACVFQAVSLRACIGLLVGQPSKLLAIDAIPGAFRPFLRGEIVLLHRGEQFHTPLLAFLEVERCLWRRA
jgi:hypothetical protein